jgi:hypothetical protein
MQPEWYNALTANLTEQQKKNLLDICVLADQRKAAKESKRIEQSGGERETGVLTNDFVVFFFYGCRFHVYTARGAHILQVWHSETFMNESRVRNKILL